jgi:hypothetical protein
MTAVSLDVDQSRAAVLPRDAPPPKVEVIQGGAAAPPPATDGGWTADKARQLVAYALKSVAGMTGIDDLKATSTELEWLGPPLCAFLNRYAPQLAGEGEMSGGAAVVLLIVLGIMAMNRVVAVRRHIAAKREAEAQAKRVGAPAEQPRAAEPVQRTAAAPAAPAKSRDPWRGTRVVGNGRDR